MALSRGGGTSGLSSEKRSDPAQGRDFLWTAEGWRGFRWIAEARRFGGRRVLPDPQCPSLGRQNFVGFLQFRPVPG